MAIIKSKKKINKKKKFSRKIKLVGGSGSNTKFENYSPKSEYSYSVKELVKAYSQAINSQSPSPFLKYSSTPKLQTLPVPVAPSVESTHVVKPGKRHGKNKGPRGNHGFF